MAKTIKGVEVFGTGKHRGSKVVDITMDDLQEMVNSFNELHDAGGFQPVVKLGHSEAQKFFGQRKGIPNLGFVEKLRIEGTKLLADLVNVPDLLFDLIKNRRFNSVSIEMFPTTEFNGKQFKNVLTAVALLGAELPAVKGLKDLAATLFTEEVENDFTGDAVELKEQDMPGTYTKEQLDEIVEAAVAKATSTVKAELAEQVATVTSERDKAVADTKTAVDALRTFEDDTRKADAAKMVDAAITAGKLLPKQKDAALAFALNISGTVKFGDEEKSMNKLFAEFIDGMPANGKTTEKGNGGDGGETFDTAAAEVHARAVAKQAEKTDMPYAEARTIVLAEDEALKLRYFEMED